MGWPGYISLRIKSNLIFFDKLFNINCVCSFYRGPLEINIMRYGNHLEMCFSNFIHKNNHTELCNFENDNILNLESN